MQTEIIRTNDTTFAVKGIVNVESAPLLLQQGLALFEASSADTLTVDLSLAEVTGSVGAALMVAWLRHARLQRKSVHYTGCSKTLLSIIDVSNLTPVLKGQS